MYGGKIPADIVRLIGEFFIPEILDLREWIDESKLLREDIFQNPAAARTCHLMDLVMKIPIYSNIIQNIIHNCDALEEIQKIVDYKSYSGLVDLCSRIELETILSCNPALFTIKNIDLSNVPMEIICQNPLLIDKIEKIMCIFPELICWVGLSMNPAAIHIIEAALKDPEKANYVCWNSLCSNPAAIHLIEAAFADPIKRNKIDWRLLAKNPAAVHLIEAALLDPNFDRNDPYMWYEISRNPAAIHLVEAALLDPDTSRCLNWDNLSRNPAAIHIIDAALKDPDNFTGSVSWRLLSKNPAAIDILKAHQNLINWKWLSKNPAIYEENPARKKLVLDIFTRVLGR